MGNYLSGQVTFSGLGSGTDFNTVVDKLIQIEGTHKRQLESWKADWQKRNEAFQQLNSSMLSLQTSLKTMDTMDEFISKEVASTSSTVLSAKALSAAELGTNSVEVFSLAQNSIWISQNGLNSPTAPLISNTGTFRYEYTDPNSKTGPRSIEIEVAAKTTLEELKNLINSDPANPGVKAAIVNDGSRYYLQLRGLDLGSKANLTIESSPFGKLGSFDEIQTNTDARLRVNGWPTGSNAYIRSSTNTVSNAIAGVLLTLKDPGVTRLTVNLNSEAIMENVRTFVSKMNEVRKLFMDLTKFDTTTKQGSIMTGNYGVQLVSSNLAQVVASPPPGFFYHTPGSNGGDLYSALSQIGILTDASEGSPTHGLLVLDESILSKAMKEDIEAVAQLFAADHIGAEEVDDPDGTKAGCFSYYSHIPSITKAGLYKVAYSVDSNGNIFNATINGFAANIDNTKGYITATEGDAKGICIMVNNRNAGDYSGKVRLKQGKCGELVDLLGVYLNKETGPLNIIEDNYNDIIRNIDKKIEYEQNRLDRMATQMKLKFSRLEALLGQYDQQTKSLESQIKKLDTNK